MDGSSPLDSLPLEEQEVPYGNIRIGATVRLKGHDGVLGKVVKYRDGDEENVLIGYEIDGNIKNIGWFTEDKLEAVNEKDIVVVEGDNGET